MPRILHVIDSLGRGGGAEQLLIHLAPRLIESGLSLEVAVLWPPEDLASELEALGVVVHRLGLRFDKRWNLAAGLSGLGRVVAKVAPDVVHAHLFYSGLYVGLLPPALPGLEARLGGRPSRTSSVLSFHNVDYDLFPANTRIKKVRKRLHGSIVRGRYDACVGVSDSVSRHFEQHLRLDSVTTIPNAVPTEDLSPHAVDRAEILARYGAPQDRFVIGMPGRLVRQKGHRYLLEALSILKTEGLEPALVLVGQGPLKAELQAEADRRGLCVNVHDPVPHEEVMNLMLAADAVAMPSLYEGFGIVAAEAMSLQRPLIASRIGPIEEFVSHEVTGLLVPPENAPELAKGLRRLIEDPALGARLGQAARAHILEHFSTEVVSRRWAQFYERVIRGL